MLLAVPELMVAVRSRAGREGSLQVPLFLPMVSVLALVDLRFDLQRTCSYDPSTLCHVFSCHWGPFKSLF